MESHRPQYRCVDADVYLVNNPVVTKLVLRSALAVAAIFRLKFWNVAVLRVVTLNETEVCHHLQSRQ